MAPDVELEAISSRSGAMTASTIAPHLMRPARLRSRHRTSTSEGQDLTASVQLSSDLDHSIPAATSIATVELPDSLQIWPYQLVHGLGRTFGFEIMALEIAARPWLKATGRNVDHIEDGEGWTRPTVVALDAVPATPLVVIAEGGAEVTLKVDGDGVKVRQQPQYGPQVLKYRTFRIDCSNFASASPASLLEAAAAVND
ncbi:hypothetical protein NL676_000792 [Syzygium grande]|nr:hypothetical protein NL676_000792 [Syzygium grande]